MSHHAQTPDYTLERSLWTNAIRVPATPLSEMRNA